jgi:capsular exopolysaccharide synthesis family protein
LATTGHGEQGRDPRYWLLLILRHKRLLLAIVVGIPAVVYAVTSLVPKTYEASATLQVGSTGSLSLFAGAPPVPAPSADDVAGLINTTQVAELAAERLDEPPANPQVLLGKVVAGTDSGGVGGTGTGTGTVTVTARDDDPDFAADLANAFATAGATEQASQAREAIDGAISDLEARAEKSEAESRAEEEALAGQILQLRGLRATQSQTTTVIEPAAPSGSPVSPRPLRNTALGLVCSLLLAGGIIPFLARMDRRIREGEEFEELTGAPLLGMVPDNAFSGDVASPHVSEAFQTLRAGLTYFNADRPLGSILVASPTHLDGKTMVATHLAVAFAQDGRNVVLLDADLRRHQAAERMSVEVGVGLDDVLAEDAKPEEALVDVEVEAGRLRVLSASSQPPNPAVLLGSARMRSLLAELSELSDIIVIDTPPLLAVSDAIPLVEQVSGVLVVARTDHTTREALSRARQVILAARGAILGVVATGARKGALHGYAGYGAGYGYVEETDRAPGRREIRADGRGPLGRVLRRRSAK